MSYPSKLWPKYNSRRTTGKYTKNVASLALLEETTRGTTLANQWMINQGQSTNTEQNQDKNNQKIMLLPDMFSTFLSNVV